MIRRYNPSFVYRTVLFFVGLLVLLLGGVPLLANFIPAAAEYIEGLPKAGSVIYLAALTIIGVIAVSYSLRRLPGYPRSPFGPWGPPGY